MHEFQLGKKFDRVWIDSRITDPEAQRRALSHFLKYGEAGPGFFMGTPETVEGFRAAIGEQAADIPSCELVHAMRSLLQRKRIWAHIEQFEMAGAIWCKVFALVGDKQRTSPICMAMHEKVLAVASAVEEVRYLSGLSPEKFGEHLEQTQPNILGLAEAGDIAGLTVINRLLPPYHPGCRTRLLLSLRPPD